jgi:hypothetical protein
MRLLEAELITIGVSYLLAAVPVGGIVLAGRMSPVYRVPLRDVCRWWGWCSVALAVFLLARAATG